ncbi:hypothetical protein [Streptomyces sp. NBC_00847]|uniref:hypothetical protein n=1 Tax=Streptomyces sp. NBC_00847 TaxID=2975850 RepID=UPI00225E48E4|nr:hypothetical protein [Streptomyces sp. NBC_00847]MCX4885948.1 hypothetical protein [Streptomyces sp. NBC_00847]
MTTILHPGMRRPRDPEVTAQVDRRFGSAPARPIVPRPLWERDRLFQEPAYADGLVLLEDDDAEDDGE